MVDWNDIEGISAAALALEPIQRALVGREVVKIIYVPGKVVNIVTRPKPLCKKDKNIMKKTPVFDSDLSLYLVYVWRKEGHFWEEEYHYYWGA